MSSQPKPSARPTGLPAGVEAGPLGKRFLAQLIDASVPIVIGLVASAINARVEDGSAAAVTTTVLAWVLGLAWFGLVWWMVATRAAGPGMRAMKLQLVGLRNGRPIGWGRFLGRTLILAALSATVVGLVVMLVLLVQHRRNQGWHDLAVDSVVIKQRSLPPRRRSQPAGSQSKPVPSRPAAVKPGGGAPASSGRPLAPSATAEVATGMGAGASAMASAPVSADSVRIRNRQPSSAPAPTQSIPRATDAGRPLGAGWFAVLDDGRELAVSGLVLLGRNPQARPGEDDAELIKVADETRTVSKTHLALGVDATGLFVMDRGSTNGTTLTTVADGSKPCPAGDVVPATEGIVSFGDHWLRIERRGDR
jgi:uncharacterized RDD family membrane protein YckC